MRTRPLLVLVGALLASSVFAASGERFSQSLSTTQREMTGIARLSSDQVAALDALVRLNLNQTAADAQKAERAAVPGGTAETTTVLATPTAFSQTLSTDQRRAAGLDSLTAEEQSAIDSIVAAQSPGAPRYEPSAPKAVEAVQFFPNRFEVHGEVGFSLGTGSGGYNSRAGWVTTSLLDTKTGTELSVTLASGREKWKRPFPYSYDWDSASFMLSAPLRLGDR